MSAQNPLRASFSIPALVTLGTSLTNKQVNVIQTHTHTQLAPPDRINLAVTSEMGYGSAAEEERMLSYSPKEIMTTSAPVASSTSLPASLGAGSTSTPPSGVNPTDPAVVARSPSPSPMGVMGPASTSRFVSYARQTWDECRPWKEFYSTRAVSRPPFNALSDRFATNLHVYRANYQVIAAFWFVIVLLGSVYSLLLAGLGFWMLEMWCTRKASQNGNQLQHKHKVMAVFLALVIIWVTAIGSFTVQSLILTAVSVGVHATFHEPDSIETEIATV